MASYKDKINQEKLSTESGRIAFALKLLEDRYKVRKDWIKELREHKGVVIYDGIYVYEELGVWYIYMPVEDKPNRYWTKIAPEYSSYETIRDVLDAQPWQYW